MIWRSSRSNLDLIKSASEEYYGTKWDNRNGIRNITWSANASVIHDESVTRSFTLEELDWIRNAFQSWDDALDSVKFTETPQSAQAEIVIGYVTLISAANQPGATGYWNAWRNDNWRNRATIKLKVGKHNRETKQCDDDANSPAAHQQTLLVNQNLKP